MENLQIYEEFKMTSSLRERVSYLGNIVSNSYMYPATIEGDKALKKVIDMGIDIIPYLVEDLRNKKHYSWVDALHKITKIKPYKSPKCSQDFVNGWINWYDTEYGNWLKNNENYENKKV
jgi:hypothetical protein